MRQAGSLVAATVVWTLLLVCGATVHAIGPGAVEASGPGRGFSPDVVLFDNGATDYGCCSEMTAFTLAEDFQLGADGTITGATLVIQSLAPFPASWDGTLDWWVYADGGGHPGEVLASGSAESFTWAWEQSGDFHAVSFELGAGVPVTARTRYWIGLHMAEDWSSQDDLHWALTAVGVLSTAQVASGPTGPWSDSAHNLAFCLWGTSSAGEPGCLRVVSSWTYGGATVAKVSGDHAFFANGTHLQVADISTVTNPQVVGEVDLRGDFWGMDVSGDHLLVPTLDGELLIVDASTPAAPTVVTALRTIGAAYEVLADGALAYVSTERGVAIFDISTVTSPVQVGFYPTGASAYAVCLDGSRAFVAATSDGLHVVDVADPTAPAQLGHLPIGGFQEYVGCGGGYAFLADGQDQVDYTGHFRVVDVSDPTAPTQVAELVGYGWLEAVKMWGSYALVSGGSGGGLRVIDVSTPTAPAEVGSVSLGTYASPWHAATTATHALVADFSGGVHIVFLEPVTAPTEVAVIPTPGSRTGLAFLGPDTLVAAGQTGLSVFDVSEPAASTEVARIDLSPSFAVYDLEVTGHLAVVAQLLEGVAVVDLAVPTTPVVLGSTPIGAGSLVRRIAASGDLVFAALNSRLEVVDISVPSSPSVIGTGLNVLARDVSVVGDTAFVAARTDGLQCVDVSVPAAPILIGGLAYDDLYATSVGTWGDHVAVGGQLVSTSEGAFMIAGVGWPADPVLEGTGELATLAYSMVAADGLVFATGREMLTVVDVGNPTSPCEVASRPDLGPSLFEPDTAGGRIAVANGSTGFHLLDYSACIGVLVFADGFESGGTSAWSAVMP